MAEGTPLLREHTLTEYPGFESLRLRQNYYINCCLYDIILQDPKANPHFGPLGVILVGGV